MGYEYNVRASKLVEFFFNIGIMLYGENRFSTNISKMNEDDENINKNIHMHLSDFSKNMGKYSKVEINRIFRNRNMRLDRPVDVFKGLHDFSVIFYRTISSKNIPLKKYYSNDLNEKLRKLNKISKKQCLVKFELPEDSYKVRDYGLKLKNCVYSYVEDIMQKRLHILGIYSKDILFACAELSGNKIVQLRGFNNSILHENDIETLRKLLSSVNISIA